MIDIKTYLELKNKHTDFYIKKDRTGDELESYNKIIDYNKSLIKRYPFLLPRNIWNGYMLDHYDYTFTLADEIPDGWRIAFGDQMLEEIRDECIKCNYLDQYTIIEIKEKFGALRLYTGPVPSNSRLSEIAYKYEAMSEKICIECGEPAKYISTGWISPYCKNCAQKIANEHNQEKQERAKSQHVICEDEPFEKYFVTLKEFEDEKELD